MRLAEVAEIAAIDTDRCPAFDPDEVLQDPLDVLSICSSLVIVVDPDSSLTDGSEYAINGTKVLLAHYSVKEYLVSTRIFESKASSFGLRPLLCHQTIAKCCLHYLLQFDRSDALTKYNLTRFALAEYSAQEWWSHAISGGDRDEEMVSLINDLLDLSSQAYLAWLRIHDPDRSWQATDFLRTLSSIPPPLYYACKFGLLDSVQFLIEKGADVNAASGRYGSTLQAASNGGYFEIVQFLIEKGVNVNAADGDYGSALQGALYRGHIKIV
jgi:hypothetical protein